MNAWINIHCTDLSTQNSFDRKRVVLPSHQCCRPACALCREIAGPRADAPGQPCHWHVRRPQWGDTPSQADTEGRHLLFTIDAAEQLRAWSVVKNVTYFWIIQIIPTIFIMFFMILVIILQVPGVQLRTRIAKMHSVSTGVQLYTNSCLNKFEITLNAQGARRPSARVDNFRTQSASTTCVSIKRADMRDHVGETTPSPPSLTNDTFFAIQVRAQILVRSRRRQSIWKYLYV